jgi:hypothetical protein
MSYLETAEGENITMAAVRAALHLRVSTGRQADNDLSIPDQRRQAKGYCVRHELFAKLRIWMVEAESA